MAPLANPGKRKVKKSMGAKELIRRAKARRHQRNAKKKKLLDKKILTALSKVAQPTTQENATAPTRSHPDATAPTVATTFPKFMQLPPELRRIVWEYTLPESRFFEPYLSSSMYPKYGIYTCHLIHKHAPTVVRGVCKEAWEVTEEHGVFMFGPFQIHDWPVSTRCRMNGCWFNPARDILYICSRPGLGDPDLDPEHDEDFGNDAQSIWCPDVINICQPRHLAFRWQFSVNHPLSIRAYIEASKRVDTVYLMDDDDSLMGFRRGEPMVYRLQDQDMVVGDIDGNSGEMLPEIWHEIRDSIEERLRETVSDTGSAIPPFRFEGLQVLRGPSRKKSWY